MSACGDEHHRASIGHRIVAGIDHHIADLDGPLVATSTIRPRAVRAVCVPREDRKIEPAAIVDIARRPFDDHPRDAAHLRADGQIAAPASGVEPRPLLHHDDVAGSCGFNRGGAKMPGVGPAFGAIQLDRQHAAGDPLSRNE